MFRKVVTLHPVEVVKWEEGLDKRDMVREEMN